MTNIDAKMSFRTRGVDLSVGLMIIEIAIEFTMSLFTSARGLTRKPFLVLILMTTVLCGVSLTSSAEGEPIHKHAYSPGQYVCYGSIPGTTHPYISGYRVDPQTGETTPVYGTCYVGIMQYRAPLLCNCGAQNGYVYENREVHSDCGQ